MVGVGQRPILKRLDTIECRDALVTRVASTAAPSPLAPLILSPSKEGEGASHSEAGEGQSPIPQSPTPPPSRGR